jgi:hypothetical protein
MSALTISYEKFVTKYKPIQNHVDTKNSHSELMFETYGEELEFVKKANPHCIWTLTDCEDTIIIQSGFNYVNRLGYFITEVPFTHGESIQVTEE